jgi:hypothetical protein
VRMNDRPRLVKRITRVVVTVSVRTAAVIAVFMDMIADKILHVTRGIRRPGAVIRDVDVIAKQPGV